MPESCLLSLPKLLFFFFFLVREGIFILLTYLSFFEGRGQELQTA
jgi:hypothetical protein